MSSSADTAKYVRIFVGYTKFTILSNENYGRGKKDVDLKLTTNYF